MNTPNTILPRAIKHTMAETIDIPHELINGTVKQSAPEIIFLNFSDAKIPVFKETRNKDYVKYGDDNRYPEYLTYLFNKSGKHGAIITGKADYIFGEGFENGDFIVNRLNESLNDISKKAILDVEIYGGFRLEIIWNAGRRVKEIYHVDFTTIRLGKDGGYYYKESWDVNNREREEYIPAFDPNNPVGSQIYAYNEYRPMTRFYPLPSYIACNNSIETDIEISKYWLSAIRNGMNPSKVIQFYTGDPGEEKKREIEASFKRKFAGAENAGKFIFIFNGGGKDKQVDIDDVSGSDLDKMFIELNKTCQQEVFSGHRVTSPMLFGIKTEGQLGGNTELATSYSIFQNTYSRPKAEAFSKEITYLMGFSAMVGEYELQPTDPLGWTIPEEVLKQAITVDEARQKLGLEVIEKPVDTDSAKTLNAISAVSPLVATKILDNLTQNEIRALALLPALDSGDVIPDAKGEVQPQVAATPTAAEVAVNDALKNLTAKQLQHVNRVVRQYSQGKMAEAMAKTLLRNGYGLTEDDITNILGIKAAAMSFSESEDSIIAMFDACGEAREDFEILKSKKVSFESHFEIEADEEIFIQEAFKTYDVTRTEDRILELIRKDKRITPAVIADTIGQSEAYVNSKIAALTKRGYLEESTSVIGEDTIIERIIPESVSAPPPIAGTTPPAQISIKYSYEVKPGVGPSIIPTSRAFCIKMIGLKRLYSRAEIESMSARLGYSVFDRKGGFWGKRPECRHRWESHIVVKRGGAK